MTTILIKGMSCQHCVASVKKTLEGLAGISNVEVSLSKNEASYDGDVSSEAAKKAIINIGFEVVE